MAADNIEQFLIEFVFDDNQSAKKIKKISEALDKLIKDTEEAANGQQTTSSQTQTALDKQNKALIRNQNTLRRSITLAKKLGLETTYFERSLAASKEAKAVSDTNDKLQEKITKEKLSQAKNAEKLKKEEELSLKTAKQQAEADKARIQKQKELNRQVEREEKLRKKNARKLSGFTYTSAMQNIRKHDRDSFDEIRKQYRGALLKGDVELQAQLNHKVREYSKELNRANRNVLNFKTAQRGLSDSTRNLIRSYASVFAVMAGTTAIMKVGQGYEQMAGAMTAATGSVEVAQEEISYLEQLSQRLGLQVVSTSEAYAKFLFAAKGKLDSSQVKELFTSLAEAGTALGVNTERMKLSFMAIQQMMNKGTVTADDLKQQLAESFPGAIQIFAKAMGVGEQELFKMMQRGELLSAEVLPKVAQEMKAVAASGGALQHRLESATHQQKRFFTALELAGKKVFYSGFDKGMGDLFKTMADSLNDSEVALEGLGSVFKGFFNVLTLGFKVLYPVVESLAFVLGKTTDVAMALFGSGGGQLAVGIAAVALAFKNLNFFVNSLYMKLFSVLVIIDEIYSLFTKGRVGFIEVAIGKDLDFSELLPDFENLNLAQEIGVVVVALTALTAANHLLRGAVNRLTVAMAAKTGVDLGDISKKTKPPKGGTPSIKDVLKNGKGLLGILGRLGIVGATIGTIGYLTSIQDQANKAQNTRLTEAGLSPLAGTRRERREILKQNNITIENKLEVNSPNADPVLVAEEVNKVVTRRMRQEVEQSLNGAYN